MASSKPGFILTTIGGIFTFIVALAILIIITATSEALSPKDGTMTIFLIIFLVVIILGIVKLYAARLMKRSHTVLKGGVIALILGIFSGPDLFSVLGGIMAIIGSDQK
ncbi:hypothetical protein GOV14_00270 [Candidatus Pacearchaeota archaeon]|nr:hypothetical protein [Candidatus Pacearchaeota archaeon]